MIYVTYVTTVEFKISLHLYSVIFRPSMDVNFVFKFIVNLKVYIKSGAFSRRLFLFVDFSTVVIMCDVRLTRFLSFCILYAFYILLLFLLCRELLMAL